MTDLQNIAREWADGQRKAAKLSADAEAQSRRYAEEMSGGAGCPQCPDWIARLDAERAKVKRLREALADLDRASLCHFFEPRGFDTPANRDTCGRCGKNFRDGAHLRADEGHPSDVLFEALFAARAALKDTDDA